MKRSDTEYDICVIGGGAGGLVVAAGGASLGAKVVLVEKSDALGGDCLHYGCVPSKTLIHSAKVAHTLRTADRFGIQAWRPDISIADVMARVKQVIDTISVHDSVDRFRKLGVDLVFGEGQFTDPLNFRVNGQELSAKTYVLATGSRPALPAIPGLDSVPYLTNETVFSLHEPIPRLLILGGGPIGMEMAQAFARLGSEVTVLQSAGQLLVREDPELVEVVAAQLRREGVRLFTGMAVARIEGDPGKIRVLTKNDEGRETTFDGTHLLVATGRASNTEGLDLDVAGVRVDRGRVVTDSRMRTTNKRIYACGDVTGPYLFTHMAEHQAGVILRNALFHLPAKAQTRAIPWCTFTDPELARVGLSETEARRQAIPYKVYTFAFGNIDRAQAEGETEGLAKIITEPKGKLLGAAIVGPSAGELIHEYALALSRNLKAADLSKVIHIYPTLAQINRRVADARLKEALTPGRRKWVKRLFGLRGR